MSTSRHLRIGLVTFAATLFVTVSAQEGPGLGETPRPELMAQWDISVAPDGSGLPPGSGSAIERAPVYALKCGACHGPQGEGLLNDRLVGGQGSIGGPAATKTVGSYWPYATTIFDYIRRAMPYPRPQSLSDDETYALTSQVESVVESEPSGCGTRTATPGSFTSKPSRQTRFFVQRTRAIIGASSTRSSGVVTRIQGAMSWSVAR
jgi:cytochrome c